MSTDAATGARAGAICWVVALCGLACLAWMPLRFAAASLLLALLPLREVLLADRRWAAAAVLAVGAALALRGATWQPIGPCGASHCTTLSGDLCPSGEPACEVPSR